MNLKDILNNKIILESKYNFIQQIFVNFSKGNLPSKNDMALLNEIAVAPVRNQSNDEIQISVDKFISKNASSAFYFFKLIYLCVNNYDEFLHDNNIKNNKILDKECKFGLTDDKHIKEAKQLYSKINESWKHIGVIFEFNDSKYSYEKDGLVKGKVFIVNLDNISKIVSLIDTKNAFNS